MIYFAELTFFHVVVPPPVKIEERDFFNLIHYIYKNILMSKSEKGDPYRSGEVVVAPPGMAMPPEEGFTPFWEKELGLLYATNKDARELDLSVGCAIRFEILSTATPRKTNVKIVYNISNL
jgi:hypothetical protein